MTTSLNSRYPSDLTDEQWSRLEPLLPMERSVGRNRLVSLRTVANAINYRWETGCVWRMLPHDFPPWNTVYSYFRIWQQAGVLRGFREILLVRPAPPRRFHPHSPSKPSNTKKLDDGFSPPSRHGQGQAK